MTFRLPFFSLLLILPLGGAPASGGRAAAPRREAVASKPAPVLKDIAAWRQGLEALDTELWDVADKRFEEALQTPDLKPEDRLRIEWKRLQTWIRGHRSAEALARLEEPAFARLPETYFWKAQALAGLGRFREAVEGFSPALDDPKAANRNEALLTRASLQLSLGDQDGAYATLEALVRSGDAKLVRLARLRQTAILIDQGKIAEARKLLPAAKTLGPADSIEQGFLDAKLLLAEGKADEAVATFAALKEQAAGQSLARYHAAAIGMADALAAAGNTDEASEQLLSEIQKEKDTPLLEACFQRLLQWLPAQPAPDDPILERLKQWIPPVPSPASPLLAAPVEKDPTRDLSGAANVLPLPAAKATPGDNLAAFAIYARAIGCYREQTAEGRHEANALMNRLRLEFPGHVLIPDALLQIGRWRLAEGNPEAAFAALDAAVRISPTSAKKGEAAFLKARAEYNSGNPEAALALFDLASTLLPARAADAAALNAALIRLQDGSMPVLPGGNDPKKESGIRADLELERALSEPSAEKRCEALQRFLAAHPAHPRDGEARLAAASSALQMRPPDPDFAKEQAAAVADDPQLAATVPPEALAWLKVEIADRSNTPRETIEAARTYLGSFGTSENAPEASLILGRAMFRNEDYHNARLVLEKMAASSPDSRAAPAALMLAARAAALGATDQSREESLALYAKVVDRNGPLSSLARLERGSLLNDLGRLDTTVAELQPWFNSLKPGDPLRVPAGLLLGDALYAQGTAKPEALPAALAIYGQLLAENKNDPALFNRLQYQRGMALERLPAGADGGNAQEKALECYFSVLQAAGDHPPAEWKWFENCGFRALKLQEDQGEWASAMKIAMKIASFKGPRSDEAAERAKGLRLEHKIWEE